MHYYGIKFSVFVGNSGFPINYVVTPASVSDGQITFELLEKSPLSIIYGDKYYMAKTSSIISVVSKSSAKKLWSFLCIQKLPYDLKFKVTKP